MSHSKELNSDYPNSDTKKFLMYTKKALNDKMMVWSLT